MSGKTTNKGPSGGPRTTSKKTLRPEDRPEALEAAAQEEAHRSSASRKRARVRRGSDHEDDDDEDNDNENNEGGAGTDAGAGAGPGPGPESDGEGGGEGEEDGAASPIVLPPVKRGRRAGGGGGGSSAGSSAGGGGASAGAAAMEADARKSALPTKLLPNDRWYTWAIVVMDPETLKPLTGYLASMHDQVTFFPTDMRHEVRKDGKVTIEGFRGLAVDCLSPGGAYMTVARLVLPVRINMKPGETMDTLPAPGSEVETSVTVPARLLHSAVKEAKPNSTMVLFGTPDSAKVFVAMSDPQGNAGFVELSTVISPSDHNTISDVDYQYQLSLPLEALKSVVQRAKDGRAEGLRVKLYRLSDVCNILCFTSEGEGITQHRAIPISVVKPLEPQGSEGGGGGGGGGGGSGTGPGGKKGFVTDQVAGLEAEVCGMLEHMDPDSTVDMPMQQDKLRSLPLLFRGMYGVQVLMNVIRSLAGNSQVTMFVGSKTGAKTPLVMRFDLGKADSFAAFVVAEMRDEDGEAEDEAAGGGGGGGGH